MYYFICSVNLTLSVLLLCKHVYQSLCLCHEVIKGFIYFARFVIFIIIEIVSK